MDAREVELCALNAAGRGLRVVFTFQGDRWRHRLDDVDGETITPVWQSLEGSGHDDWPPSPALQDLSLETLPDGRQVIFLVGKAGSSHWSASIEAMPEPPQLIFDIACRHGAAPGSLGSQYTLLVTNLPIQIGKSDLETNGVTAGERSVMIAPQLESSPKPLQTTRWKYRANLLA